MNHEIVLRPGLYASASGSLRQETRGTLLARIRQIGVGDSIECEQTVLPVIEIRTHPPGKAPSEAPISALCVVHELVTAQGSWWWGEFPDETDKCPLCNRDGRHPA